MIVEWDIRLDYRPNVSKIGNGGVQTTTNGIREQSWRYGGAA
jgi:hypothetical protein